MGAAALTVGGPMKLARVVVVAVLAAVGGAVLGRTVLAPAPAPVAGENDRAARAEARVKELEERVASLQKARDEATLAPASGAATAPPASAGAGRTAEAAREAEAAAEAAKAAEEAAKKEAAARARAPRIAVAGSADFLAAVDWGVVGTNLSAMTPLISQFAKRFAEDGTMDPEVVGKINVYNGPLVTAALAAGQRSKLEPNTAFTHPAFMVNAIAATLEAAKLPLSDAQQASLAELAGRYTSELARLPASGPETWALTALVAESELRERFFVDAFRLLAAEQLAVLTPPYAKDRLQMDLFSAGLMWLAHAQTVPFQGREDLVATLEASAAQALGIGAAERPSFHEVIGEWAAASLPRTWLEGDPDPLDAKGFVKVQRVHEAARLEVALLERWADRSRPDEAGWKKLRGASTVLVPVRAVPPK